MTIRHLAIGLVAAILVALFVKLLSAFARGLGLVDTPDHRKRHTGTIPLVGGLAMCLAYTLAMIAFAPATAAQYSALLLGGYVVMLTGLMDDLRDVSVPLRFGLQIVALVLICVTSGFGIQSLGDLVGSGPILLGIATIPFTIFAVVGILNAMNMSDGLDGLTGGLTLAALACFGTAIYARGDAAVLGMVVMLAGCVAGFLCFNLRGPWRRRASVFMGDSGSMFLGFVLAWLAVHLSQGPQASIHPITAVWILGLPIMDAVYVMIRRPLRGVSPFTSGRDHLHYLLVDSGLSVSATVWLLISVSALMGTVGLAADFLGWSEAAMFSAFLLLSGCYYAAVSALERRVLASVDGAAERV
jgi:UDP-GlcNAc:undecaprenyl-phosphate GlcNAc-1-phosphate transferase